MTTITLDEATERNDGRFHVFGSYDSKEAPYVFGGKYFAVKDAAERYARRLLAAHPGARFEQIKG